MTQLVTVQTDFRDLEQMAQGLAGRVHATHVILPARESVDEGEWAQFEIALFDGSAGLVGLGRCVTVVDNGDERLPHQRFDVVFDSLQFETHEQRVFDHILALHGVGGRELDQLSDADAESLPPQVSETTGSYVDVSTDFSQPMQVEDAVEEEGEPTMVASTEELEAAISEYQSDRPAPGGGANDVTPQAPAPMAPVAPPPMQPPAAAYSYARAATAQAVEPAFEEAFEEPVSGERIAPTRPLNGSAFAYANGIPIPAKPPRPELDAALRVTPAPRPARAH